MKAQALLIARVEIRRTFRTVRESRTKVAIYAILALVLAVPTVGVGAFALAAAGEGVAADGIGEAAGEVTAVVTGGVAVGTVGVVVFAAARAVTTVAKLDQPGFLVLSAPVRTVVAGLVLAEIGLFLCWLGVPTAVLAGAFAWGAAAPLVVPAALATLTVVLVAGVSVGFLVGICLRHLLTVYEPIARYRTVLFLTVGAVYFGAIAFGAFDTVVAVLFDRLAGSPLGWPGQLLLAAVPTINGVVGEGAVAALGSLATAGPVVLLSTRVAAIHWIADPVRSDDDHERAAGRLDGSLSMVLPPRVTAVTATTIRRTKRAPVRLIYVAYPLFGALFFIQQILATGTVPSYVVVLLAVYVVWAAGAAFTLNILGDRGPAMESVLLSTVSGREIVAGTVGAGTLLGLPFALSAPVLAGLASPLGLLETGVLTAGAVIGVCVAPGLATGIGVAFPRFGAVRVTNTRDAVIPSKTAFVLYTVGLLAPILAGVTLYLDSGTEIVAAVLTGVLSVLPAGSVTVTGQAVAVAAGLTIVAGVIAPVLSVRHAATRIDEYRPY